MNWRCHALALSFSNNVESSYDQCLPGGSQSLCSANCSGCSERKTNSDEGQGQHGDCIGVPDSTLLRPETKPKRGGRSEARCLLAGRIITSCSRNFFASSADQGQGCPARTPQPAATPPVMLSPIYQCIFGKSIYPIQTQPSAVQREKTPLPVGIPSEESQELFNRFIEREICQY